MEEAQLLCGCLIRGDWLGLVLGRDWERLTLTSSGSLAGTRPVNWEIIQDRSETTGRAALQVQYGPDSCRSDYPSSCLAIRPEQTAAPPGPNTPVLKRRKSLFGFHGTQPAFPSPSSLFSRRDSFPVAWYRLAPRFCASHGLLVFGSPLAQPSCLLCASLPQTTTWPVLLKTWTSAILNSERANRRKCRWCGSSGQHLQVSSLSSASCVLIFIIYSVRALQRWAAAAAHHAVKRL